MLGQGLGSGIVEGSLDLDDSVILWQQMLVALGSSPQRGCPSLRSPLVSAVSTACLGRLGQSTSRARDAAGTSACGHPGGAVVVVSRWGRKGSLGAESSQVVVVAP